MPRPAVISKDDILDVALRAIDDVGFEGFNLRLLAERMGVSHPALYRHISSKEGLISELLELQFERALNAVDLSAQPLERLRSIGSALRAQFEQHPNLLRPLINSSALGPNAAEIGGQTVLALKKLGISEDRLTFWLRIFENLVVGGMVFDNAASPHHLSIRADRLAKLKEAGLISKAPTAKDVMRENQTAFEAALGTLLLAAESEAKGR